MTRQHLIPKEHSLSSLEEELLAERVDLDDQLSHAYGAWKQDVLLARYVANHCIGIISRWAKQHPGLVDKTVTCCVCGAGIAPTDVFGLVQYVDEDWHDTNLSLNG